MNVVSFALWGNDLKYRRGLALNRTLCDLYYPGWVMRVYCEPHHTSSAIAAGCQVRERSITRGAWEGLFWRFDPIVDPQVDRFISRDLDSRLNPREAAAVADWIASGKFAHVMRDHVWHDVAMVGGMWGCCHWPQFAEELKSWSSYDHKGCDQEFLQAHIWPKLVGRVKIHDSVRQAEGIEPFPPHAPLDPKIHGTFVGSILS